MAKEKTITLVSLIKEIGAKGTKSRKELAEKVFAKCQSLGIKQNSKGKEIKQENVLNLVNSYTRDVKTKRQGHWQAMKVEESENSFKILPR